MNRQPESAVPVEFFLQARHTVPAFDSKIPANPGQSRFRTVPESTAPLRPLPELSSRLPERQNQSEQSWLSNQRQGLYCQPAAELNQSLPIEQREWIEQAARCENAASRRRPKRIRKF